MKTPENKTNFYPYAIAIFLVLMVCGIVATVVISLKNAPENDDAYFSSRQDIDAAINDILKEQRSLEERYDFLVFKNGEWANLERKIHKKTSTPILAENLVLRLKIAEKNAPDSRGEAIKNAAVRAKIGRFATSRQDSEIGFVDEGAGVFASTPIALKKGKWKAVFAFEIEGKKAFFEQLVVAGDEPHDIERTNN